MTPKFNQVFFGILVRLVCHVESLEDFGDITHIENIVRFGWCRQELLLNSVEEMD